MSFSDQDHVLLRRLVEAAEKIATALTTPLLVYKEPTGPQDPGRQNPPYSDAMAKTTGRNVPEWVRENSPATPEATDVPKHKLVGNTAWTTSEGFFTECTCGWKSPPWLSHPDEAHRWFRNHVIDNTTPASNLIPEP